MQATDPANPAPEGKKPQRFQYGYRQVWSNFRTGILHGAILTRSTSIAFLLFLASLPTIIFFFSMIPFIPLHNFRHELLDVIHALLPANAADSISRNLSLIMVKRKSIPIMGVATAVFFSLNAINGVIQAFNATTHTLESRKLAERIRVSFYLLLVWSFLVVAAVSLIVMEKVFMLHLNSMGLLHISIIRILIVIFRWIIIMLLIFFGIAFIYYLGPAKRNHRKFFNQGALIATLLILLASLGFSYFVNNYAPFNRINGSIGTIMAGMIWMNFNSIALLLGFEWSASFGQGNEQE